MLVQEFLQGKEYVVDKVSKDGVHKVIFTNVAAMFGNSYEK